MDAYVTKQIGETIKHQRLLKGMTIEAFAKQIDISKLTLIKIERGDGNPTLSVIWKIANGLQVPVASLLATNNEVEISRKKSQACSNKHRRDVYCGTYFSAKRI